MTNASVLSQQLDSNDDSPDVIHSPESSQASQQQVHDTDESNDDTTTPTISNSSQSNVTDPTEPKVEMTVASEVDASQQEELIEKVDEPLSIENNTIAALNDTHNVVENDKESSATESSGSDVDYVNETSSSIETPGNINETNETSNLIEPSSNVSSVNETNQENDMKNETSEEPPQEESHAVENKTSTTLESQMRKEKIIMNNTETRHQVDSTDEMIKEDDGVENKTKTDSEEATTGEEGVETEIRPIDDQNYTEDDSDTLLPTKNGANHDNTTSHDDQNVTVASETATSSEENNNTITEQPKEESDIPPLQVDTSNSSSINNVTSSNNNVTSSNTTSSNTASSSESSSPQKEEEKESLSSEADAEEKEVEKEPKAGSLASFFKKVNKKKKKPKKKQPSSEQKAQSKNETAPSKTGNHTSSTASGADGDAAGATQDGQAMEARDYGYTTIWGRKMTMEKAPRLGDEFDSSTLQGLEGSQQGLAGEASYRGGMMEGTNQPGESSQTSLEGDRSSSASFDDDRHHGPAKSVNSEFVTGLDGFNKFMEAVDPPDELDVSAAGSSMQEVLMGQGGQILAKPVVLAFKRVKRFFQQRKDEDGNFALVTKKEVDMVRKKLLKACRQFARKVRDLLEDIFDGSNKKGGSSFLGLEVDQEQSKLEKLRQRLANERETGIPKQSRKNVDDVEAFMQQRLARLQKGGGLQ